MHELYALRILGCTVPFGKAEKAIYSRLERKVDWTGLDRSGEKREERRLEANRMPARRMHSRLRYGRQNSTIFRIRELKCGLSGTAISIAIANHVFRLVIEFLREQCVECL